MGVVVSKGDTTVSIDAQMTTQSLLHTYMS